MKILDLIFNEMVGQQPPGKACELQENLKVRQSSNYARVSSLRESTEKMNLKSLLRWGRGKSHPAATVSTWHSGSSCGLFIFPSSM